MIRFLLLILSQVLRLAGISAPVFEENQLNPYLANDRRVGDFPVRIDVGEGDEAFKTSPWLTWDKFRHRFLLFDLDDDYNLPHSLPSRLSRKLLSFITNTGDAARDIPESLRNSVEITSQLGVARNFAPFALDRHVMTIRMRPPLTKLELLDVVPSTSQITVDFWRRGSFIGKNSTTETVYRTEDPDQDLQVKFQIIGSKLGMNYFRIYFLCLLNGVYPSVVTYSGSFYVIGAELPFQIRFAAPHSIVRYGTPAKRQLLFTNTMRHTVGITEVRISGAHILLDDPPKDLRSTFQGVRDATGGLTELRFKPPLEFPPNAVRPPLVNLTLFHPTVNSSVPTESSLTESLRESAQIFQQQTLTSPSWLRGQRLPPNQTGDEEGDSGTAVSEADSSSRMPTDGDQFAHVESHSVSLLLDSKRFYFNFLSIFNPPKSFWDHESMNLGVLCDQEVSHSASVFASNRYGRPVILRSFRVTNQGEDFRIKLATPYSKDVLLPFVGESLLLLKIVVSYQGLGLLAHLNARLIARLEVGTEIVEEELPIFCTFNDRLFHIVADHNEFGVGPDNEKFFLHAVQDTGHNISISKIDVHPSPDNDNMYAVDNIWIRMVDSHRGVMAPSQTVPVFHFTFIPPRDDSRKLTNRFTITFHTLETYFSTQVKFPYKTITCARGRYSQSYQFCSDSFPVDLGVFTPLGRMHFSQSVKIRNNQRQPFKVTSFAYEGVTPDFGLQVEFKLKDKNTEHRIGGYMMVPGERMIASDLNLKIRPEFELLLVFRVRFPRPLAQLPPEGRVFLVPVTLELAGKPSVHIHLRFTYSDNELFQAGPLVAGFRLPSVLEKAEQVFRVVSHLPVQIHSHTLTVVGSNKEMVRVEVLEKISSEQEWVFAFKAILDPTVLLGARANPLRIANDFAAPTVKDLDVLEKEQIIWDLLQAKHTYKFGVKFVLRTDIGTKTVFLWKGTLKKRRLTDRELVVRFDPTVPVNFVPVTLYNPSNKIVRARMFIAPSRFFDYEQVMEEVKTKLKAVERRELLGTTCLEHSAIGGEMAKFLVSRMIRANLRFVDVSRILPASSSHLVCFKTLRPTVQRKFDTQLKNLHYFFKFSHIDLGEAVSNYMKGMQLVLKDVEEFTADNLILEASIPSTRVRQFGLIEFLGSAAWSVLGFLFGVGPARQSRPRVDNNRSIFIDSVKNISAFLAQKSIFFNQKTIGRSFKIASQSNLTIRNALVFVPEAHVNNSRQEEYSLFIKTDTGLVDKVPVVLEKRSFKLGHVHPDPQHPHNPNNTIFVNLRASRYTTKASSFALPIKRRITFSNDGEIPIRITKILFENGLRSDICLEISLVRPVTLQPSDLLHLPLVLHPCRKISSLLKTRLIVFTTSQILPFDLQVHLEDFHVTLSRENRFVLLAFVGQGLVFTFLAVWFSFWILRHKKKPEATEVRFLGSQAAFLAKEVRFEKLCKFVVTIRFGTKKQSGYRRQLILDELNRRETQEKLLPEMELESEEEAVEESALRLPLHALALPSETGHEVRMTEYSNTSLALVNEIFNDAASREAANPHDKDELLQKAQVADNVNLSDNQFGVIGDRFHPMNASRLSPQANRTTSLVSPIATKSKFSFQISEYRGMEPSLELEDMRMDAPWPRKQSAPRSNTPSPTPSDDRSLENNDLEQIFDPDETPKDPKPTGSVAKPKFYSKEELEQMEKNIFEPPRLEVAKLRLHSIIRGVEADQFLAGEGATRTPRNRNRRLKRQSEG